MDGELLQTIVLRWLHVLSAVVIAGGLVYMRFVLLPGGEAAVAEREADDRTGESRKRWFLLVHLAIVLLLATGLYNYLFVYSPQLEGQGLYHGLFGIKFLLALVVFFFASVLSSRGNFYKKLRRRDPLWTTLATVCAILVVLLGGVMYVVRLS